MPMIRGPKDGKRSRPNVGWKANDYGSVLEEPDYMKLGGPWIDGKAPEDQ